MSTPPCEASLFAQIPHDRHEQVLSIMAGLAAMQPQLSYTRHVIFAPVAVEAATDDQQTLQKKTKQTAQRPLVYTQITARLNDTDFGTPMPLRDGDRWTVRVPHTPDPEFTDPIVRRVDTSKPNFDALLDTRQFRRAGEYIIESQQFVIRDVVLSLQRILVYAPGENVPDFKACRLLDASGAFLIEATVRIADRTRPALVQAAFEQLTALRSELRGVVALKAPERLSMDARIKMVRV